jgi:ankyrin repeat protein
VLVKALIAAGADPKHAMPNGATALMYAAGLGWRNGSALAPSYDQGTDAEAVETIEFLLTQGLSLRDQDKDGNTALHLAVAGRASEPIITYLVKEAGADPSIRNVKGQTVLAAAKAKRDGAAVVALLESLGVTDSAVAATAVGAQ